MAEPHIIPLNAFVAGQLIFKAVKPFNKIAINRSLSSASMPLQTLRIFNNEYLIQNFYVWYITFIKFNFHLFFTSFINSFDLALFNSNIF